MLLSLKKVTKDFANCVRPIYCPFLREKGVNVGNGLDRSVYVTFGGKSNQYPKGHANRGGAA